MIVGEIQIRVSLDMEVIEVNRRWEANSAIIIRLLRITL